MAVRLSCVIHCLLLLCFAGCALHMPAGSPPFHDAEIREARSFVQAVEEKIPLWDADVLAPYERLEIAIVKADIAMAEQSSDGDTILRYANKLRDDWNALIALDEVLRKVSFA